MQERIIYAFIEEAKQTGLKCTMDAIAKRVGCSKRTLYENFSSKREMIEELIERSFTQFENEMQIIAKDSTLSLQEKIRQTILVLPEHNDFYDNRIFEQLAQFYPDLWSRVKESLTTWPELEVLMRQGINEGIIEISNPTFLVKIVIEAVSLTFDQAFFQEEQVSVKDALETIVDVLLNGFLKE